MRRMRERGREKREKRRRQGRGVREEGPEIWWDEEEWTRRGG